MFRLGVTKHLRSAVIQQSLLSAPIMGPRLRPIPAVKMDVDGPIRNIAIRKAGSTESVALRHVVDQLIAIAGPLRSVHRRSGTMPEWWLLSQASIREC